MDSSSGIPGTGLDFEDQLGLAETAASPYLYFRWRYHPVHRIELEYYELLRNGTNVIGSSFRIGDVSGNAGVSIFTRSLGKTDAPATTTFYFQTMLSLFALGPALYVWVTPSLSDIPALIVLATAGTAAPYCLVRAVVHIEVTVAGPIEFLRLPISAGIAWILFSEVTDMWTWVGGGIIIAAAYFMTRQEHKTAGN